MIISPEIAFLVGSLLVYVSILAGRTGYKIGVPVLLFFLLVGMLFGQDGIGLQFDSAEHAQSLGMVAMSIILFAGGMDTQFKDIRAVLKPGIVLSTVGVLLTALFTGLFIWGLSGFSWSGIHFSFLGALLLAATMSSTDAASVFAILSSQRLHLKQNLRPMLELESGSNDPVAYMLTILLIQILQSGDLSVWDIAFTFVVQFLVGGLAGYFFGWLAVKKINKLNIDNQALYPILLLSMVGLTFSITTVLKGNGYLAVYIAGMMVGNNKIAYRKETYTFIDGISWLFQIIMFLVLGLLVNPHELTNVALVSVLIGIFMIVVARPATVFLCLLPFRNYTFKAKSFISWVGLRGAAPIVFATYPVVAKVEGAHVLFNIVFFITLLSLLIQGTTVALAANKMELSLPAPKEGNEFGVEIPEEIGSDLHDLTITAEMLATGDTLKDMNIPKGTLVIMIKRDEDILIPNGTLRLQEGDKLLVITERDAEEAPLLSQQQE